MLPRSMMIRSVKGVVASAAAALSVGTQAIAQDAEDVSQVALISESTTVLPGQNVLLGLHFELAEGWHVYWDGFNDISATVIHTRPHTTVGTPVISASMAASERSSGRSRTSLLMSRMA